jgi:hypothetical protein
MPILIQNNNMVDPSFPDGTPFGLDQSVFPKVQAPAQIKIPTPPSIRIKDRRTVNATSGEPINPNKDLKTDDYPTDPMVEAVRSAKMRGEDPWNALAILFQESKFGKLDPDNPGRILNSSRNFDKATSPIDDSVLIMHNKLSAARKAGHLDDLHQLQYYNGTGEKGTHLIIPGHGEITDNMYGVKIPKSGLNVMENPIYGKRIVDLRDNVLKKDLNVQNIVDTTKVIPSILPNSPARIDNSMNLLKYKK